LPGELAARVMSDGLIVQPSRRRLLPLGGRTRINSREPRDALSIPQHWAEPGGGLSGKRPKIARNGLADY